MGDPIAGRTTLVTGASSGIGRALARELAGEGAHLALLARRRERLEEVAGELRSRGVGALAVPADVTREEEVRAAVEEVRGWRGPVEILVNNAGTGLIAPLEETPVEEAAGLFDLNVLGMLRTIRAVVPGMRERGEGRVVQISSGAALKTLPLNTVYSATKAAVASLSEGLRLETEGSGIRVHCVYPVGTRTDFLEASRNHVGTEASGRFFRGKLTPVQTAESVARATVRGIRRGRAEIYPYRALRAVVLLDAVWPGLAERLAGLRAYRDRVLEGREAAGRRGDASESPEERGGSG